MKLPVKTLQCLAAAITLTGMSGCGFLPSSNSEQATSTEQSTRSRQNNDPAKPEVCEPNNDPAKPGLRAPCPACGRG